MGRSKVNYFNNGYSAISSPCRGCSDRVMRCHSTCSDYLAYKDKYLKHNERVLKAKLEEDIFMAHIKHKHDRIKKNNFR